MRVYDDEEEREQQLAVDDRHKKASWRNNVFVPLGTWQQRAHGLRTRASKPIFLRGRLIFLCVSGVSLLFQVCSVALLRSVSASCSCAATTSR
jgi:hypothetical protein